MMASSHEAARLRQGLNPLTTSLVGYNNNQLTTPMSALSMTSSHISAQTPASAIQPYNPQQWGHAPPIGQERTPQFGDPQGSPLPPPPYSPPRSQHSVNNSFDHSLNNTPTPAPRFSQNPLRPSPEPHRVNPLFSPPPGSSARNGSRERRFGLPSFSRSRGNVERNSSSPDLRPPMPQARQSMVIPSTFHLPTADPGSQDIPFSPPAARRAASAGAVETPTSARSRAPSQTRWAPGMPIPPPPPGPPPPSSRSQSVQPMDRNTVPIISPPTRRPPPSTGGTTLGPVPPTPAGWVDSDHPPPQASRGRSPGLTIDTETANNTPNITEALGSSSSSAGLNRTGAVRHDKTIIQRRSESRNRHGPRESIDGRVQPGAIADIVVPKSTNLARRMALGKTTPRSGQLDTPGTGESLLLDADSRNSTPRALPSAKLPKLDTGTPPFSPNPSKQPIYNDQPATVAPKALPTPPPHTRSSSKSRPRESSRPPLASSAPVSKHQIVTQTADQFAAGTIERFQAFAAKEVAAATDADRVRLFADFIVNESRIRRERYSSAIGAMGSETFDLTRDLFRPMIPSASSRRDSSASRGEWTPASTDPVRPRQGSFSSSHQGEGSQSAPGSASILESPGSAPAPANATYSSNFMPSLSPILSMGASDNYENGSSRGRPPSRWWEVDSQGEPSNMERHSKRESKHMAVSRKQWVEEEAIPYAGPSDQFASMEYPPEKTGWHEEPVLTPQPPNFSTTSLSSTLGSTPTSLAQQDQMDVSRLVTLPPPYPRHHPAVNNNHPELTSIRTSVRALSEISKVKTTKDAFEVATSKRREDFAKEATERRLNLRATLQQEINSGNIGYAEAGVIEQDTQQEEINKKKELEKMEYEQFQNQVVLPLNDLLTDRISRATDLFDDLARSLFDDGRIDADIPQEEGDDRPELLEKLTLLKWIFEARETLHRAIYDLLSDRNSRYCEVILTPYRLTKNTEKLKSAESFFAEDAAKREYAFANEVLNRARDFRGVIEEAVSHGVALQLSAFWDIAPPLCELLGKVPSDLEGFSIQIPQAEFEENPAYHEHPVQYLFSLLLHAEKSSYQFIESHTNLLCLLHEVKEAVANAKGRVLETQTEDADGKPISEAERQQRAQQMRQAEEHRLTEDLKEKVRLVGEQWNDALGEDIKLVKERLGEWLLSTGGWDESLEDGGVGAA